MVGSSGFAWIAPFTSVGRKEDTGLELALLRHKVALLALKTAIETTEKGSHRLVKVGMAVGRQGGLAIFQTLTKT